ncbi:MAG: hypothetical protein FWH55_08095 [Oscillospiraceae bacterium]|nr:hypothetical protein [Oscillospiraceae bacterium]
MSIAEKRRREKIETIQSLLKEGFAPVQVKEMLQTTYNSIRRYATGDPEKLCRFGRATPSELDSYQAEIIQLLQQNMPKNKALEQIQGLGYQGRGSSAIIRVALSSHRANPLSVKLSAFSRCSVLVTKTDYYGRTKEGAPPLRSIAVN